MHKMTNFGAYGDHPEGGLQDVMKIDLVPGFVVVSVEDLEKLQAGLPTQKPVPVLSLTTREVNALFRIHTMAWDSIDQSSKGLKKDQNSCWAAARALGKLREYLKGPK